MAAGDTYEIFVRCLVRRYYYRADSPVVLGGVSHSFRGWGDDQQIFQAVVSQYLQPDPPSWFLCYRGCDDALKISSARWEWSTRQAMRLINRRTGATYWWPREADPSRVTPPPPPPPSPARVFTPSYPYRLRTLGQLPMLPGLPALPARPADWPVGVPFPPSPRSDGTAPLGWPAGRDWPPPVPANWPSELAWPNPRPPPAPPGWAGPWPLVPTCWPTDSAGQPVFWPPPAPALWAQTGLPWPPIPTQTVTLTPQFEQQFRAIVQWWPAGCPILISQPTTTPPAPTLQPPAEAAPAPLPRQPPPLTAPIVPAPPATLSDALRNPVVIILLGLAVVRTIAAVSRARQPAR